MSAATVRIGVIIGSTRKPRACPEITRFVIDTIESARLDPLGEKPTLVPIDLGEWNLPLFDESNIPSQVTDSSEYDHEHTCAWSREILKYHGFIFVVPQYNWGYPAALKNAIDYLFNEWKGKPAMVVTYGGHGGGKCNAQLTEVLQGLRMLPTKKTVLLSFPGRELLVKAASGKNMGLDGSSENGIWSENRSDISDAFEELCELIKAQSSAI